uniref:Uncharacterized protein n=1 Tax=Timema poppense TaxID=170557 RepID=A0A7R9D5W9_TIMPO|nr:unnamed protein product [Timema poppensis]
MLYFILKNVALTRDIRRCKRIASSQLFQDVLSSTNSSSEDRLKALVYQFTQESQNVRTYDVIYYKLCDLDKRES